MKLKNKLISLLLIAIMLVPAALLTACDGFEEEQGGGGQVLEPMLDPTPMDDNYRTVYQIFVGSFSDANGDGFGDIRGIINRMDYLNDGDINNGNDLGVQALWLSPIFSSPSYHKYDAKDYYALDWRFGSEADLVELIELCRERNVKLILDLAINHTSNQHEWFLQFKEAREKGDTSNKYYNYYSCVTTSQKKSTRRYQQIAGTDYWYECNFSGGMPELNYDNTEVRQEMLKVAQYYLALGVDGFRFDAVKYIYFEEGPTKNVNFWNWYMGELRKEYPDMYAVGECWSGDTEVLKYYTAFNCFNFTAAQTGGKIASAAKGNSLSSYLNYVESYQDSVQAVSSDRMPMFFLSNHDTDRIAGTFINENNMRMAASLYLLTPGSHTIYYGEEIGMRGSVGTANSDANLRLAMLWGDGDLVKDPKGTTYDPKNQVQTTVKDSLENSVSLLNHYRELISIRTKYPAIARGDYNVVTSSQKNFGGFYVKYEGAVLGIFHNTSLTELTIDLSKCSGIDGIRFTQLLEVVGVANATLENGILKIGPQTSVVVK